MYTGVEGWKETHYPRCPNLTPINGEVEGRDTRKKKLESPVMSRLVILLDIKSLEVKSRSVQTGIDFTFLLFRESSVERGRVLETTYRKQKVILDSVRNTQGHQEQIHPCPTLSYEGRTVCKDETR